jgi:hypothetical protein
MKPVVIVKTTNNKELTWRCYHSLHDDFNNNGNSVAAEAKKAQI